MDDCWEVLGISPTLDQDDIKGAYRKLIKAFHPDRTEVPELKRKNTVRCVAINLAYQEAIKRARTGRLISQREVLSLMGIRSAMANSRLAMPGVVGIVVLSFLFYLFLPAIMTLPEGSLIREGGGAFLGFAAAFIFFGLFLSGLAIAVPLFILVNGEWLSSILNKAGFGQHRYKLWWALLAVLNLVFFFVPGNPLLPAELYSESTSLRLSWSLALPLILIADWLLKIGRYPMNRQRFKKIEEELEMESLPYFQENRGK